MDLHALICRDFPDDRPADGDAANVDVAFDRRAFPDDQLILGHDFSIEAAIDAHGVFEFQFSLERSTAIDKAVQLSTTLVLHHRLPVNSSNIRIRSSSLAKRM